MNGIELLIEEHNNIEKALNLAEKECIEILEGKEIDNEFFKFIIKFIREYADRHHHGKEEDILFKYMMEDLGELADKLVRNGMLVEHDLGRLYIMELENSLRLYEKDRSSKNKLDIITNLMSYVHLLRRHIYKENKVAYRFAEKNLSNERLEQIDLEIFKVEKKSNVLDLLLELEGYIA